MPISLTSHLSALTGPNRSASLVGLQRGIEKESLRVLPSGELARTSHPAALGSALTHPNITTDFSEAQLELITQVNDSVDGCMQELTDVHRYVYEHLDNELLWASSMPCVLAGDDIPLGYYGESNIGRTKTVYRQGLATRYGPLMQTISGIHYNFSIPDPLWTVLAEVRGRSLDQDFKTDAYFGLIRNFRRHSWLLIYLFGASPALCKSFVNDTPHALEHFDEGSLYLPNATSLRMGRLGYQSDAQADLHISYNSLAQYAESIRHAMTQPFPAYEALGVKVDGRYLQLSSTLIQIENEFYGTIRPKRRIASGERPLTTLNERGVEYVEVRCIDLNPFLPVGIDAAQIRFLDTFLLHCLLSESPPDSRTESARLIDNQLTVVERGRAPDATLMRSDQQISITEWATSLLDECGDIASLLDEAHAGSAYREAWHQQRDRVADPALTPSARILAAMREKDVPFFRFAMDRSIAHRDQFLAEPMDQGMRTRFEQLAQQSLTDQLVIEANDVLDFDSFLASYLKLPENP